MTKPNKKPFKIDFTLDCDQTPKPPKLEGKFDCKRFDAFKVKHSQAKPFSQLLVFGDSLSDTGNVFKLTGQTFPPSPPYFEGRFSNGPIWVDTIAPELGLSDNKVKSFAFGGATTGRDNVENVRLGANFLPGLLNEIDSFTSAPGFCGADPKALYVVWAGGNDFLQIAETPQNAPNVIAQAVANISTAITTLVQQGAKHIVVPNQVNFGLVPLARDRGLSEVATQATIGFNQALAQGLAQLEQTLKIDLIEVDVFSVVERIAAAPGEFGFSNISNALIKQTNPVNPEGYFWWDDVHPTTQAQQIYADTIRTAVSAARLPRYDKASSSSNIFEPKITLATSNPLQV